jgi:two-component system response regulator MprA
VTTAQRILVVEDDHGLRGVIARGLREERFAVVTAADGASALSAVDATIDAIVLDVRLPDADGRDVCQAMRAAGISAPVVFLTAHHLLTDRLAGFAAGADDYIPKPFHPAELAARVRAALSRTGRRPGIAAGGVHLDPLRHAATVAGRTVSLSPTEFRLLACLMAAPGDAVRRRVLLGAAWPHGAMVSHNTLDQYIARLRRKLRDADSGTGIDTVRGVGYRFG